MIGTARILREGHIPYGVVTNITLDQLSRFRAVFLPNVLEMTEEQANHFREFVRNGGVLYASGPSSLSAPELGDPRFLLEDVLGVRYLGGFGESVTYLSPASPEIAKVIWPQENVTLPWSMVRAQSLPGAQVAGHGDLALRGAECRIHYRSALCADLEQSPCGKARQRSRHCCEFVWQRQSDLGCRPRRSAH